MAGLSTGSVKVEDLVREIDEASYCVVEGAVGEGVIAAIERELQLWRLPMNENDVHAVAIRNGIYFSHAIAKSPTLFHLITDPFVLALSRARLGDDCRLKCHRVYSIYPGFDQPWHTDNKAHGMKEARLDGLVFIVYFKDVADGELRLLRGSHRWNDRYPHSIFDDEVIDTRHAADVVSLKRPKGTLIVYDAKAVHRAVPIRDKHWHRTSLFFQVDSFGGDAEKTLLDVAFLDNLTPEVMRFLGFGKPSTYPTAPSETSLSTLLPRQLLDVQKDLLVAFARTSARGFIDLFSREFKHRLQHLARKEVKWNTIFNS
jgi:ectoine hydroxylase-related dioxygenase (phytanoyl-CoA dioxygenase family)